MGAPFFAAFARSGDFSSRKSRNSVMSNPSTNMPLPRWLAVHAAAVFAFLYLPVAVLILYSFNGQGVGGFPPRHLTIDWYRILFSDGAIWDSVLNSLQVAFAAMIISLAFGIPAAFCARSSPIPRQSTVSPSRASTAHPARDHHRTLIADAV